MSKLEEIYLITFLIILILSYILHFKIRGARFVIMFCSIVSSTIYIIWRFTVIPPRGFSLVLGILLLLAEIMGIIQFFNFGYFSTRKYKLKKKSLVDPFNADLPSVDILICTYNEPVDLLRKTAIAPKNLKYTNEKKQNTELINLYVENLKSYYALKRDK